MVNSVGFLIIWNNKILLAHPNKQSSNTWTIPKGKVEKDETYLGCAIRETKEEIGLDINPNLVDAFSEWKTIIYKNIHNKSYKKLHYKIIHINNLSDIDMISEIVENETIPNREIDKARFMTKDEALDKIFWRQKELLEYIPL